MKTREQDESSQPTAAGRAALPQGRWARWLGRLGGHGTLVRFGSASMLHSTIAMATGIVILRWLDPEEIGLWQSLLLVPAYAMVIQGGIINGLKRELPFLLGAGEEQTAVEMAGTAKSVAFAGASLLLLAGVAALFYPAALSVRYGSAVLFVGAACLLYVEYLWVMYRADQAFDTLARIHLAEAAMEIVTLPLVYYFHFVGLASRYLVTILFSVSINHVFCPIHAPIRFSRRHAVVLLKVGVPTFVCAYLFGVANTFPRIILLSQSGIELVGLFAPASAVVGLMQMLPYALVQYVFTKMSFAFGKTGDPRSVWPIAWKTAVGLLVVSLPMLAVGELVVPWLVVRLFPKYAESVPAVRWALVTGVFLGASISVHALFSLKAWGWVGLYTAVRVATAYLLPLVLFYWMANSLEGVAAGFLFAHALSFVMMMYCVYRATHAPAAARDAAAAGSAVT